MVEDIVIISELVGLQVDTGGCEKLMEEYSELSAGTATENECQGAF